MRMAQLPGALLLIVCIPSAHAAIAADEAADYENRIEFAYLSEDARELKSLARALTSEAADDGGDRLSHYLAAHADYRLAQVLDAARKPGADDSAKACIDALAELTHTDSSDAEAFAQKAACHGFLAGVSVIKSVRHGPAAGDAVATASRLAPKNPRVHLADALVDYWRPARLGGDRARAFGKFKRSAELYEAEAPGSTRFPSWGSADVYLWLGRSYLERGDVAAARSALEKALIVAPDFAAARRELAKLASRSEAH
jgi:tetratricopeptide (TPR) repeat protein